MDNSKKPSAVMLVAIYLATLTAGIVCTLLLASEITARLIFSLVFIALAYTVLFALIELALLDIRQNGMQDFALAALAAVYFAATVAVSLVLNLLPCSNRLFWAAEIIVLAVGTASILCAFIAKRHIEK